MTNVYIAALPKDLPIGEIHCQARKNEIEKISNERVKKEKYFVWKLLCHALKHTLGIDEQNLNFAKLDCGAWTIDGLEISLSHSDDALAVAVSQTPIGIDVERVHKPRSNRMAEYMMNEREIEIFNCEPVENRELRLIEIWTAKEAIFKSQKSQNFIPKQIDTLSHSTKTINFQIYGEEYVCTIAQPTPEPINVFCDVEFLGVDYMFANVLYFDNTEDVDIISIPEYIYDKLEVYGQQFCDWLGSSNVDDEYYVIIDGRKCISLETSGFVNWLNKYICLENDKAYIVQQHTKLNTLYKTIDF